MNTVYSSNSRIMNLLKDQDGPNWRDKLPQHPDQHRIKQALTEQANGTNAWTNVTNTWINATKTDNDGSRAKPAESSGGNNMTSDTGLVTGNDDCKESQFTNNVTGEGTSTQPLTTTTTTTSTTNFKTEVFKNAKSAVSVKTLFLNIHR